jgi:hypothetical protein
MMLSQRGYDVCSEVLQHSAESQLVLSPFAFAATHTAQLQSSCGTAPQGGLHAHPEHSKAATLFTSSFRPQTAHQRKNSGKMGTRSCEAEFSGAGSRPSCPKIPRYSSPPGRSCHGLSALCASQDGVDCSVAGLQDGAFIKPLAQCSRA